MKNIAITIIFLTSITNSFSQLHLGFEFAHTTNQLLESDLSIISSSKSIIYINYKFKKYVLEFYYGDDKITSFNSFGTYKNTFYDFGILAGSINRYETKTNLQTSIGVYKRLYSRSNNLINDFGEKIGIMGKLQFGIELKKGLNTGFTYRFYQDIYNLFENQNQLLLNQSAFCFTFEISLSVLYDKFKKK